MIKSGFSPWGEMKTSSPFFKSIWKVLFGNDCIVKFLFPSKIGLTISVVTMQGSPARLLIWINCVFPCFLLADTLNVPSVRRPE